ncbi:hypothetical protein TNCV_3909961 [Trichonephila clavipes]|nr:hypothetical protein TNCV_3909961 [Trichonephila clavipes]
MESCFHIGLKVSYHVGDVQTVDRIQIVLRTVSNSLQDRTGEQGVRGQFYGKLNMPRMKVPPLAYCGKHFTTNPNGMKQQQTYATQNSLLSNPED